MVLYIFHLLKAFSNHFDNIFYNIVNELNSFVANEIFVFTIFHPKVSF